MQQSLKAAVLEKKMERFSYEGGCGVRERTRIETFKRRVIDKRLRVISNKMLFKTVVPLRN